MSQKRCYSELTHPSMRESIRQHNCYALQLAMLVAEFAQQIATAYENFSKELETVIETFRKSSNDLKKDRPSDTPSSIFAAWETLLQETENDAQAHLDVAGLLIKNVYKPLEEIATHKTSQAHKLYQFRDVFEDLIKRSEEHLLELEKEYHNSYKRYSNIMSTSGRETAKSDFYNAHNDYVLQFRASNCLVEKVQDVLPAVLEELEEIHIDTCNTIKVAIESHALVLLTKATERHRRFDDLLKVCHQVNPQLDISYFIRSMSQDTIKLQLSPYDFNSPANVNAEVMEHESVRDQLILDRHTESTIRTRRQAVQKEAAELTSYIKQNQDVTQSLVNMCQRSTDSDKSFDKSPSASFDLSPDSPQSSIMTDDRPPESPRSFSREESFECDPSETSPFRRTSKLSLDRQSHVSHQSGHNTETAYGGPPISPDSDPHDPSNIPHGHHSYRQGGHHQHHAHLRRRRRLLSSLSTDDSHKDYDEVQRNHPKRSTSCAGYTGLDLDGHHAQFERALRNLANHLYAKVYETQEDMCRKRNEIRLANIQLAAVRAQIEVLSPNHNGAVESADQEPKKTHSSASIKGMWKKAVKSLKSNSGEPKPTRLSKKGSLIKRKDSKEGSEGEGAEEEKPAGRGRHQSAQEIDPVYSLLKCAADLPKARGSCTHTHCTGHHARHSQPGDSACGNTSKNSSPCSSEVPSSKQKEKQARKKDEVQRQSRPKREAVNQDIVHSPKGRRKKLNSRMKSFSLDTPDPPKQLLAIDETTKKKSSSFTNTCIGALLSPTQQPELNCAACPSSVPVQPSPLDSAQRSSAYIRHKLGGRSSSLEIDESKTGTGSFSFSPNPSPVSSNQNLSPQPKSISRKKSEDIYVVLYNFKGKEKDDLDLRAGWRLSVLDSSKKDWWKGRCNGKSGHFPAAYVERLQPGQRIFQVTSPIHINEGDVDVRFHKDQIVLQVGDESNGSIMVKSMNNRQAVCPLKYLIEV